MADGMMKAVRFHEYGGLEKLVVEEVARPTPKANEALIRMKAAGVNPADWKFRAGYMKEWAPLQLPAVSGLDGAGVVEAVGSAVTNLRVGQAVFGIIGGSYAEYAVAGASEVIAKPENLTFDQAATVPVGALTAWSLAIVDGKAVPGMRVLVLGGAGGVGLFAVQLAVGKGARVSGTASTENIPYLRSLGVDEAIDYRTPSYEQRLTGFDLVLDTVGGDALEKAWGMVRRGGTLLSVAGMIDAKRAEGLGIQAKYTGRAPTQHLTELTELLRAKKLTTRLGKTFPLSEARKAHELSETGHGNGRIVLHIAD